MLINLFHEIIVIVQIFAIDLKKKKKWLGNE